MHGRHVCRGAAIAVALTSLLLVAACGDDTYSGGDVAYSKSTSEHFSAGARSVVPLSQLPGDVPVTVVEGTVVDVRPDRGWVNLPEEQIKKDIDVRETSFDSQEASFRTILADVKVAEVLYTGTNAGKVTAPQLKPGETVAVTLILHNDSSVDSAEEELSSQPLIIPLTGLTRGAFGQIVEPAGGSDILVSRDSSNALSMPFATTDVASAVLGSARTKGELARSLREANAR